MLYARPYSSFFNYIIFLWEKANDYTIFDLFPAFVFDIERFLLYNLFVDFKKTKYKELL